MRNRAAAAIAGLLSLGVADAQTAEPGASIDRIEQIGSALDRCVGRALGGAGLSPGHDATLRLSFRRDGSIIGEPRIAYSSPSREEPEQRRFIEAVQRAFASCAPLPFSKGLGGAIAGKIFAFRYTLTEAKDETP